MTQDKLGVAPHEALYVGDHPVDAEAARHAGMEFRGIDRRGDSR